VIIDTTTEPKLDELRFICARLSASERDQYEALGFGDFQPEALAEALHAKPGPKLLMRADGVPVACGGYDSVGVGVMQSWMVGTVEGWARHGRAITRETRRFMRVLLSVEGIRRLQTMCLADRAEARRWYEAIGLDFEGTLRGFAQDGRDCALYARVES
jgi:hypothetical protein